MLQKIIAGILIAAALFYIARRIYNTAVKGESKSCAACEPGETKDLVKK